MRRLTDLLAKERAEKAQLVAQVIAERKQLRGDLDKVSMGGGLEQHAAGKAGTAPGQAQWAARSVNGRHAACSPPNLLPPAYSSRCTVACSADARAGAQAGPEASDHD